MDAASPDDSSTPTAPTSPHAGPCAHLDHPRPGVPGVSLHWCDEQAEIHRIVVGDYENNVFVLRCRQTGQSVLIDAANEHDKLLELCRALNVQSVLETHGHWDHIQAVPAVRAAGYRVAVTADDAAMLPSYDDLLEDETVLEVGRLRLHTICTPGHTPGSQCFMLDGALVSGDTLFLEGCGRTDLPGSNPDDMYDSLNMLSSLPSDTIVYPGHRYSDPAFLAMGQVRETNYVFKPTSKEGWLQWFGQ